MRIAAYHLGMTGTTRPAQAYERDETESERLDRNWNEILQELRVTQTGTQILTGFLLTVAFQPRFTELSEFQVVVYLALVATAAVTTALALAPVSLHRQLFRKRAKDRIVRAANRILQLALVGVGLTLTGTMMLIFDVVAGHVAGIVVGIATVVMLAALWLALPVRHRLSEDARTGGDPAVSAG
jgi:hypothetical protein